MKTLRHALLLGLVLVACSGGTTSLETSAPPPPVKQGEVTGPTSGLTVTASIIAATLGDDCASASGGSFSGDCAAPAQDAGAGKAAPGGCGSFCQQSNVQLSFKASAGSAAAKIEIVSVTLHDATSGSELDTLTAKNPKAWSGNGYVTWDQTVKPSAETKASYDLSAPAWSSIGSSYSKKYTLHVTLKIDGTLLVLESTTLSREPAVAT